MRRLADPIVTALIPEPRVVGLALVSAAVMGLLTANYAIGAVHQLHRNESVRPVGSAIRHVVPPGQRVAVLRPGFLPFLFYVNDLVYLQSPEGLSPSLHYLLVRQDDLPAASASLDKQGFSYRTVYQAQDKRIKEARGVWLLLSLDRPDEPGL